MTRRSKDWNEGLAKDLQDPKFACEFILASLDEGIPLQVALGKMIKSYGIIEFAKKAKMASPNLLRAIHPKHNLTQQTLNRLLSVFDLKLMVAPVSRQKKKKAA